MKINSFNIMITEDEAKNMAKKRMSVFGRLLVRGAGSLHMKTIFIENKIITLEVTNVPPPFARWFAKKEPHKSKIQIIANGSTCGVSYYDRSGLNLAELDVDEEQLQRSAFPDHQLILRANALARRILRRRVGGNVTLETLSVESVFRPYHVAFFGELIEGVRVRYMPIPADNNTVRKTF